MNCEVRRDGEKRELFLRLNFGDKMQRELTSELKDGRYSGRVMVVFIFFTMCTTTVYQFSLVSMGIPFHFWF